MNDENAMDYFYCLECPKCKHRLYDVFITGAGMRCEAPDRNCEGNYMVRLLDRDPFAGKEEENNE